MLLLYVVCIIISYVILKHNRENTSVSGLHRNASFSLKNYLESFEGNFVVRKHIFEGYSTSHSIFGCLNDMVVGYQCHVEPFFALHVGNNPVATFQVPFLPPLCSATTFKFA